MRRLYVTSLMQANNCSHMYRLKLAGIEPLPMEDTAKAGILFERAASFYLPRTEGVSAEEAVQAADDYGADERIKSFLAYALKNLPNELLAAKDISFGVQGERAFDDEGMLISGYIDLVADGRIYELKYTQKHITAPSRSHIFQLQHYMFMLDKEEATIVYACNTKRPTVLAYEVQRWSKEKYMAVLRALSVRYDEDAPLGLIHDWQCDYCAFRHVCQYYNEKDELSLCHEAKLS